MSMLGPELTEARVVDLFAGSGALGLEALSRGARHATFVERGRPALRCLRANIEALGAGEVTTVAVADVFDFIAGLSERSFDIALADPPYGRGLARRLVQRFRRAPFARVLSIEHGVAEDVDLPPEAHERRYGETMIAFVPAARGEEE